MAKQPDDLEKQEALEALATALLKDGEGRDFFKHTGEYLWKPDTSTFRFWWWKGAFSYSMWVGGSMPQVSAYWRQGVVYVAHNGQERHKAWENFGVR